MFDNKELKKNISFISIITSRHFKKNFPNVLKLQKYLGSFNIKLLLYKITLYRLTAVKRLIVFHSVLTLFFEHLIL